MGQSWHEWASPGMAWLINGDQETRRAYLHAEPIVYQPCPWPLSRRTRRKPVCSTAGLNRLTPSIRSRQAEGVHPVDSGNINGPTHDCGLRPRGLIERMTIGIQYRS